MVEDVSKFSPEQFGNLEGFSLGDIPDSDLEVSGMANTGR